ncbi:MAG: hypothetical protein WC359_12320 [Dehalococcoidia bacterium]|jgi:hypothetical protein
MSAEREVKECRALTIDLIRIVNVSQGMVRGWDRFDREYRVEFLDKLREHTRKLIEEKSISNAAYEKYVGVLDKYQRYNEQESGIDNKGMLYEQALDLAINAIHNCVEKTK